MTNQVPDKPFRLHWTFIPIIITIFIVANVMFMFNFHTDNVWPLDVISSDLLKANGDISVAGKIDYLSQAHSDLAAYNGNPKWPWPTPYYDIDKTKLLISASADDALSLLHLVGVDDYAYQQGVVNLNNHIGNLASRISDHANSIGWNPHLNPIGWILGFVTYLSPGWSILIWCASQARADHIDRDNWQRVRNY